MRAERLRTLSGKGVRQQILKTGMLDPLFGVAVLVGFGQRMLDTQLAGIIAHRGVRLDLSRGDAMLSAAISPKMCHFANARPQSAPY